MRGPQSSAADPSWGGRTAAAKEPKLPNGPPPLEAYRREALEGLVVPATKPSSGSGRKGPERAGGNQRPDAEPKDSEDQEKETKKGKKKKEKPEELPRGRTREKGRREAAEEKKEKGKRPRKGKKKEDQEQKGIRGRRQRRGGAQATKEAQKGKTGGNEGLRVGGGNGSTQGARRNAAPPKRQRQQQCGPEASTCRGRCGTPHPRKRGADLCGRSEEHGVPQGRGAHSGGYDRGATRRPDLPEASVQGLQYKVFIDTPVEESGYLLDPGKACSFWSHLAAKLSHERKNSWASKAAAAGCKQASGIVANRRTQQQAACRKQQQAASRLQLRAISK